MKINYDPETKRIIELFLKQTLEHSGAKGYVVGLSGGLDSAVAATLAVRAVGEKKVTALLMPTSENESEDHAHALLLADKLGIEHKEFPIDAPRDLLCKQLGIEEPIDMGNIASRLRMTILYAMARKGSLLVLGTSNKSELLVGYFTKYGDGGSDVNPLGDLYKTQINQMAFDLDIPNEIIDKAPRAGLIAGQTDESDLGMSYGELDSILYCIERRMDTPEIISNTGYSKENIEKVIGYVKRSIHKRRLGLIPKIGLRTVGLDWREI